jgi:TetR/AcrR family fatty acid metabolism transcriptional regulator
MPVARKTKKDVLLEFRKTELLHAARTVFAQKGFHDATIEEIAEAAQVAKGTVYLYYKSKKELYLEALRFGIEILNQELETRSTQPGTFEEKLRRLTASKLAFFDANRDFFRILYSELGRLPSHPASSAGVKDLYFAQAKIFQRVLQEGIRRREVRTINSEKAAFAITDLTRSVTTQRLLGCSNANIETDTDFIVDFILKGIVR